MGTTLQNGVYLPNEGERNCYAGLKTNWEILDQKVADVTALQQAVAGALHREIVESLPTTDIDPNTIYMILSGTSATENVYNEFMYVNNAWELIGTSATDLTNYYTKAEVDGKLLLKANASDLTSHTGDTTIHVTTADKTKWNNGVSQAYVFRYSSTALVASSTNSNTLLDNTDNLKVGDKVIDSNGVLFSITAIDTVNSTFTVGTALIDLAQDSDVVHKSGDETISGVKTFSNNPLVGNSNTNITISNRQITANGSASTTGNNAYSFMQLQAQVNYADSSPSIGVTVGLSIQENAYSDGKRAGFTPNSNNTINLGLAGKRWANVYATNYYYGGSEIEFSQKFVTTDTNQTITGQKIFSTTPYIYNTDSTGNTPSIFLRNSKVTKGGSDTGNQSIFFTDKDNKTLSKVFTDNPSNGTTSLNLRVGTLDDNNADVSAEVYLFAAKNGTKVLQASADNDIYLGRTTNRWKDTCTCLINGLTPSSLSLPSSSGAIDISSYITDLTGGNVNTYTPPANGYIVITCNSTDVDYIKISNNLDFVSVVDNTNNQFTSGILGVWQPCVAGIGIQIRIKASALNSARFIPCQGNV